MRVIFAGTPEFARAALERLAAAGFSIPLVLTQPDRPAGRGLKLQPSPVKQAALDRGIAVVQPRSLRLDGKHPDDAKAAQLAISEARADVMVVAAYGLILPSWALRAPRLGCLNIHASLLPRWRGAAPIHRAIEAGDAESGVTIMQMDEGLDTGDMLLVERVAITPQDTTASLHDKLAALGARLIVEALELAACGGLHPQRQPAEGVTYAHKIEKAEARIDWSLAADVIERRIRAFDPSPGALTQLGDETVKVWRAKALMRDRCSMAPGTVVSVEERGIRVACGEGCLLLDELQRAGGKRLAACEFVRGFTVSPGMRFGGSA